MLCLHGENNCSFRIEIGVHKSLSVPVLLLDQRHQHRRPLHVQRARGHVRRAGPEIAEEALLQMPAQHLRTSVRDLLQRFRAEEVAAVYNREEVHVRT